jgi:predicted enzyme related to lactoylglutathione lyase
MPAPEPGARTRSHAHLQEKQPSGSPIALHVADARTELEATGVEFLGETIDSGVCFQAVFKDPDGNVLILHHRYAPRD